MTRIPAPLKLGWAIWLVIWIPVHAIAYGLTSFLWVCALGNILVGVALWREDSLLLSMQAVSVLLLQGLYTFDLAARAISGRHAIGGTEYVFVADSPLGVRLLSLFHVVMPVAIVYGLSKLGYDRRALRFQISAGWLVLAMSLVCGPGANVNGVWFPPVGRLTTSWPVYFVLLGAGLTFLVYVPTHLVLARWDERARPATATLPAG